MHKRLVGIAASAVVIVAACGGATPSTPAGSTGASAPPASATPAPSVATTADELFGTAYSPAEGPDGGTIIIGDWQEATALNPFYYQQVTEANVISATTATTYILTNDYKYAADLATEIPTTASGGVVVPGTNGDAMTVTWTLRDGLKWSDGEPLTCDDFRYAWEWVLNPDNVGIGTLVTYQAIKDWECVSDTEMVVHYNVIQESYITDATAPLPRHYLEAIPITDQVAGKGFRPDDIANMPVSGAFKYESMTPGSEIRLAKNPNYTSWKTGKPAHLDSIIFKWYGDADAMIAGYRGGEIDMATDLQDSDLVKVEDLGDQVSAIPALLYEYLRPNWSDTELDNETGGCSHNPAVAASVRGEGCPMADPAMREAFAFAIDKNEINTRLLGGTVQIANTNISPDAWFFADQPPATYDPAKAIEILEAGGWTDSDGDGIREKDGLKAIVELCTTTRQVRQDTLALIADWLKAVGIQGIPNAVSPDDIFATFNESTRDTACVLSHSNFDLAEHASSSSIDPIGNYFSYHSSQFAPDGVNNAQVKNTELDAALDGVKTSVDFDVVKQFMADFQTVYVDQTVEIPLYYRKNVDLHAPKLGNFLANPTQAGPTWNVVDWFAQ